MNSHSISMRSSLIFLAYLASQSFAQDCTLNVPKDPLTAQGLATPYRLAGSNCNQGNFNNAGTFVEATILDMATGKLFVYHPLVIDEGSTPAVAPIVPALPKYAAVGIWFGSNANTVTLIGDGAASCVNGVNGSIFSQFADCNAAGFFKAANEAIMRRLLKVPAIGVGIDMQPCPTTRDFRVVDQDQSDNVVTGYLLVTSTGQTAQNNAANKAALPGSIEIDNGSDNRLLDAFMDKALNCEIFTAPSLDAPGTVSGSLALNELSAAAHQMAPVALVPSTDPMVTDNGVPNLEKLNLYRVGVNQPKVENLQQANPKAYCNHLVFDGIAGLNKAETKKALLNFRTPVASLGNNLFNFLAARSAATLQNLDCLQLLNITNPWILTTDAGGAVVNATAVIPTKPVAKGTAPKGKKGKGVVHPAVKKGKGTKKAVKKAKKGVVKKGNQFNAPKGTLNWH